MVKFNKKKLFEKAKEAAKEKELIFIEEIVSYLPCGKTTFYEYFPANSEEMNELKTIIEDNAVEIKSGLRKKWRESENPTLQIALYRLTSRTDEHKKLNQAYIDHTTDGEKIDNKFEILIVDNNENNQQEDK
jgi:hypothetical protein